jgi:hypothetical protein
MSREERRNHRAFLDECNEQLPELAAYVFSLRTTSYMGCGFHYGLEKQLGHMIKMCNDYDRVLDISTQIIDQVLWEGFIKDVNRIKDELANK